MPRLTRLLIAVFMTQLAFMVVSRGVYFYLEQLRFESGFTFGRNERLLVALGHGLVYVIAALLSHRLAVRFSEKRVILGSMAAFIGAAGVLLIAQPPWLLVVCILVFSIIQGSMWPVIESYISAGRTPRRAARAVGHFNLCWSGAVPVAIAVSGPLVYLSRPEQWGWPVFFAVPGALALLSMLLLRRIEARPDHLDHNHPERPTGDTLQHYRRLLLSSRWQLMGSYAMLYLLAPLLPDIFGGLGYGVIAATALAALLDLGRFAAFVFMRSYAGWHGRTVWLLVPLVAMPAGFLLALVAGQTAGVIAGEVLFGITAGVVYYCALYYAMVVKNASVDAGGAHEAMIGAGFAIGPVVGLATIGLAVVTHSNLAGTLLGTAPLVAAIMAAGFRPLRKLSQSARESDPSPQSPSTPSV